MKKNVPVVIVGGGVSGLAAALTIAEAGKQVVLLEKSAHVGGAAASVPIPENRVVPMGYHQIVGSDKHLVRMLERLSLIDRVQWKRTTIGSLVGKKRVNLASPIDMLLFHRLPFISRLRYLFFGARCLVTHDWTNWENKSVTKLITEWADKKVLKEIFKPLIDIKFGFSTDVADAAWLGKRLSHREGATPFGYIPNASWTQELCNALAARIEILGGKVITQATVKELVNDKKMITGVVYEKNGKTQTVQTSTVLSTLPPPALASVLKQSKAPKKWAESIKDITYTSAYSMLAGVKKQPFKDYWTIFLQPRKVLAGCFTFSLLNETLTTEKDAAVINLFTNVPFGKYKWTTAEFESIAQKELSERVGEQVTFNWTRTAIIPFVSPVFEKSYQNPPHQLAPNLYLAGIFRTYPKLSSTGEAMADGEEVAKKLLESLV